VVSVLFKNYGAREYELSVRFWHFDDAEAIHIQNSGCMDGGYSCRGGSLRGLCSICRKTSPRPFGPDTTVLITSSSSPLSNQALKPACSGQLLVSMLSTLPVEILERIVSHLPTASSIVSLSLANRTLYQKLSANNYAIFRSFIKKAFPSFEPPPLWRDAACALTSHSRAWDRHAFIARECVLPQDDRWLRAANPGAHQSFGYVPIIDSYATWSGPRWADGKEVLVWGDWGRLRTCVTENGNVKWSSWRSPDDHLPENDLLDVRILRPHQNTNMQGESFLLRKANREIIKLESRPGRDVFEQVSQYATPSDPVDCMDITSSTSPVLAVCNTQAITLYPVNSDSVTILPSDTCQLDQPHTLKHRQRCAKFLSDTSLAVAVQFVEGRSRSPINIYDVGPAGLSNTPLAATYSLGTSACDRPLGRHCANTIAPLDATGSLAGRPGQVFLSGWSDGIARLHDLRDPRASRAEYIDVVDDGQILSLLVMGHERFLAGSHQNACLKVFDLRMPGGRVYDYLHAAPARCGRRNAASPRRDINIFLALHLPKSRTWSPLPTNHRPSTPRYRGSIYTLSCPSPISPTIYAGIENHVISLSTISTDDWRSASKFPALQPILEHSAGIPNLSSYERPRPSHASTDNWRSAPKFLALKPSYERSRPSHASTDNWRSAPKFPALKPILERSADILNISSYERPRPGHASTDAVLLRKQMDWDRMPCVATAQGVDDGWDERWWPATYGGAAGRHGGGLGRWSWAP
jgi:hypothetical protein